jgi:putative acetyltransferase
VRVRPAALSPWVLRGFLFRNGEDGRALTLIEEQQLISSSVVSAAARRCSWTCDDVVMSTAELAAYSPGDQEGFASLVNDTHAEYGFSYHPVLDKDLADPVASYSHVWVLISEGSVVGSVALTVPLNGTTTLKRMYVRPHFRGEGWGRQLLDTAIRTPASEGCRRIKLDTSDRQVQAVRLYEAAGFVLQRRDAGSRFYVKTLDFVDI